MNKFVSNKKLERSIKYNSLDSKIINTTAKFDAVFKYKSIGTNKYFADISNKNIIIDLNSSSSDGSWDLDSEIVIRAYNASMKTINGATINYISNGKLTFDNNIVPVTYSSNVYTVSNNDINSDILENIIAFSGSNGQDTVKLNVTGISDDGTDTQITVQNGIPSTEISIFYNKIKMDLNTSTSITIPEMIEIKNLNESELRFIVNTKDIGKFQKLFVDDYKSIDNQIGIYMENIQDYDIVYDKLSNNDLDFNILTSGSGKAFEQNYNNHYKGFKNRLIIDGSGDLDS